jgi:hypothetical protein
MGQYQEAIDKVNNEIKKMSERIFQIEEMKAALYMINNDL